VRAGAGSGFITFYKAVWKAETACKNHDEAINFIVRVIVSCLFYFSKLIFRLSVKPQFNPIVVTLNGRFSFWKGIIL